MSGQDTPPRAPSGQSDPSLRSLPLSTHAAGGDGVEPLPGVGPPPRPRTKGALGDYEIVRKLGAGGMGIVYLARRAPPPRSQTAEAPLTEPTAVGSPTHGAAPAVLAGLSDAAPRSGEGFMAIKVLQPELAADPRMARLFLKEAQRLQALDHPGIVKVIEVGADDRESYFVMPYLAGGNLGQTLRPGTPADIPTILRIAKGVGTALKHIHDKGLVHGDVKPANILLDQRGDPVLADLGLGRRVSSDTWVDLEQKRPGGTLQYMAPEVVAGNPGDARRDIYALGVVLYEMLTGELPYEGQTPVELERKISGGIHLPIRVRNPRAPAGLAAVADRAMAHQLADRYADMSYLLQDLDRVAGEPTARLTPTRSPDRWRRRLAVALALLALLISVGFLASSWRHVSRDVFPARLSLLWSAELPGNQTWAKTLVGDYLGDGSPALYRVAENCLSVQSPRNPRIPHLNQKLLVPDGVTAHLDVLLEGPSRRQEAAVTWRDRSNFVIGVYNANGLTLGREFRVPARPWVEPPGKQAQAVIQAAVQALVTNTPDGRPRLLAAVNAAWEGKPRGIYCWPLAAHVQTWEWHHEVAGWVSRVLAGDVDGDGTQELVYALSAVGTTNRVGDTDDDHAYVGVLDLDGRRQHQWVVGGKSNWVDIALGDFDGSGKQRIVAGVSLNERTEVRGPRPGVGRVLCFDERGTDLGHVELDAELVDLRLGDVNGDGRSEVVTTDRLGQVYVIASDFRRHHQRLVVTNAFSSVWLCCDAIADLDRDGQPELVVRSTQVEWRRGNNPGWEGLEPNRAQYRNNSVLILDPHLEPLAAPYVVAENWDDMPRFSVRVWRHQDAGSPAIVVLSDRAVGLSYARNRR